MISMVKEIFFESWTSVGQSSLIIFQTVDFFELKGINKSDKWLVILKRISLDKVIYRVQEMVFVLLWPCVFPIRLITMTHATKWNRNKIQPHMRCNLSHKLLDERSEEWNGIPINCKTTAMGLRKLSISSLDLKKFIYSWIQKQFKTIRGALYKYLSRTRDLQNVKHSTKGLFRMKTLLSSGPHVIFRWN